MPNLIFSEKGKQNLRMLPATFVTGTLMCTLNVLKYFYTKISEQMAHILKQGRPPATSVTGTFCSENLVYEIVGHLPYGKCPTIL